MMKVPRHEFVPEKYINRAYGDYPLPIGEGQTISQPYIVAIMTELLELKEGDKVLEIGTGSGYQAAILGEITREVYTIEIIGKLAGKAKNTLLSQNYDYIKTKVGDGYFGWEEYAPFDAIIVTAAPSHIPPPLKKQLKDGGRMIIPVGMPGAYQTLWQVRKSGEKFEMNNVMGVSFVPFTRAR
jgi:protein-L-isoaspartate(D-aspartate) O-methyltransferase